MPRRLSLRAILVTASQLAVWSTLGSCASGTSSGSAPSDADAGSSGSASGGASGSGSPSSSSSGASASSSSGSSGGSSSSGSGSGSSSSSGSATPGDSGGGGSPDAGADASGNDAATCTLPTAAQTCAHTVLANAFFVDFSTYNASGTWGDASAGDLTGGTSPFQGTGVNALALAVQGAAPNAVLQVTGTVPTGSYAGFVLWFGPCVNARADGDSGLVFSGMNIPIGGTLGGATMKFQVQSQEDYPVDVTNKKGACLYASCGTKYSDCAGPTLSLQTLPATPTATNFPWSGFSGGVPVPTTTGDGIVGLQFQFECPAATPCSVSVSIGTIALVM